MLPYLPRRDPLPERWRDLAAQLRGLHDGMPSVLQHALAADVDPTTLSAVHLTGEGEPRGYPVLRFGPCADCVLVSPAGAIEQRERVRSPDSDDQHERLHVEFHRLTARANAAWRRASTAPTADQGRRWDQLGDRIWHRRDVVEDAIVTLPATNARGAAVKLRMVQDWQREGCDYPEMKARLVEQVLAWLERV